MNLLKFRTKKKIPAGRFNNKVAFIICISIVLLLSLLLVVKYGTYVQAENVTANKLVAAKNLETLCFQQTIYDGVTVKGIAVGGDTKAEAKALLVEQLKGKVALPEVTIAYNGKSWSLDKQDFSSAIDVDAAVQNAWEIGRTGTDEERMTEINKAKDEGIDVSATFVQNPDFIYNELVKIKKVIDIQMVNATVSMTFDTKANFVYTDAITGYKLDVDAAYKDICDLLKTSSKFTYTLKPAVVTPTIVRSQLEKNYVKISTATTPLGNSQPERQNNILLSLKVFDLLSLMPGETLSFNNLVGERTEEKGYESAVFINANQVYDVTDGGGICQTTTTLYDAALYAGATVNGKNGTIGIIERNPHSWPSVYIGAGLDASVNWPTADLKLRNNGASPIFFHTYYKNSKVCVEIYGEPLPNNAKVTITTEVVSNTPAPANVEVMDTQNKYALAPGQKYLVPHSAHDGITVNTFQIWSEDGKDDVKTLINTSVYQPIAGKVYVGVTR